jgi:hypothetical protein
MAKEKQKEKQLELPTVFCKYCFKKLGKEESIIFDKGGFRKEPPMYKYLCEKTKEVDNSMAPLKKYELSIDGYVYKFCNVYEQKKCLLFEVET